MTWIPLPKLRIRIDEKGRARSDPPQPLKDAFSYVDNWLLDHEDDPLFHVVREWFQQAERDLELTLEPKWPHREAGARQEIA